MRTLFLYSPMLKRYENDYMDSSKGWKPISVTGTSCAFNCKHCGKRVLEGMADGSTQSSFEREFMEAVMRGDEGVILSGGSTGRGDVPVWKYSELTRKYSNKMTIIAHTGVVKSDEIAKKFKDAGVRIALLDMVGDDETIRDVLGQPFTVEDYLNSFKYLKGAGMKVTPHVIVGLSKRGVEGDLHALDLLKEVSPDAVIVVGLMPLVGTKMQDFRQPSPQEMEAVIRKARDEFDVPVMLGCARPRGSSYLRVEKFAVDYGIDGIAFPEEETIEYARGRREIHLSSACCGNVVQDILRV
ncbi:radical SAM protein [Sulfuracidifex tepidarius]|uniref:Biotin synthase n=1 Tax=Sulfuracidifex tepidarius TaxID=1294262 RepID=A0A510DTY5_9CREN|nr:radical SAM protein [Sulfuracidifex tepidarius]BBG23508.1 Biotin synthase [Sulfuracidifex tepidarius]BBG26261.1 Biotin synthase [Sulfuracidifex tepidarius]